MLLLQPVHKISPSDSGPVNRKGRAKQHKMKGKQEELDMRVTATLPGTSQATHNENCRKTRVAT